MSIKQGELMRKLRIENELSQEQLAEKLGISRQSVSKWEQGQSTPDIDNFVKLSALYEVPLDLLIKGEEAPSRDAADSPRRLSRPPEDKDPNKEKSKKKRGWFFVSYPIIAVIAYLLTGYFFGGRGWATGWIILLTIPLFYTGIISYEKKNPVIFCYPVLVLIAFLMAGFFLNAWHPAWILFLTIPIFYIAAVKLKRKNRS